MAWLYLFIAGIFEATWAICLKFTEGWTKLWPSIVTFICLISSFLCLSLSLEKIPIGTAYAVWTGIGIIGTVSVGIMFLNEPNNLLRLACILLILIGIIGLRLFSPL